MANKLHTPKFRVSFPSVFEATQINGQGKSKYRITMLFDLAEIAKDPAEQARWDAIKAELDPTLLKKFGSIPADYAKPFIDGNTMKKAETGVIYEGHEGMVVVRAASEDRPGLVDQNVQPIMDQSDFYGGCYARATVNMFAWEYMNKKGVSVGIQNIQKLADGETFSGKTKAEDDFAAVAQVEAVAATDNSLFE